MTDSEIRQYHFEELIKTLITLSLPAKKQIEFMGYGSVGSEMAEEFDWHFRMYRKEFQDHKLLSQDQLTAVDLLYNFMEERHGNEEYQDFWLDNAQLPSHPEWDKIRQLAKECLVVLKKDHLELKVSVQNRPDKSSTGKKLTIQTINTELVEKKK